MDRMHARMRDVLLPLFRQHGVPEPFAIWSTDQPEACVMTWMLKWPGLSERNATWAGFRPVWESAKKARGGQEFVTRTDLTLVDAWADATLAFPAGANVCESSWVVQPKVGLGAAFRAASLAGRCRAFIGRGALNVAASDFMFGPLPQSLVILSWADDSSRDLGVSILQESLGDGIAGEDLELRSTLATPGIWLPLTRASYLPTWELKTGP